MLFFVRYIEKKNLTAVCVSMFQTCASDQLIYVYVYMFINIYANVYMGIRNIRIKIWHANDLNLDITIDITVHLYIHAYSESYHAITSL